MKNPKERLEAILKSKNENYNSLAKKIGKKTQVLYDIRDGKVKSISFEISSLIKSIYPDLNHDWMHLGEGDMFIHKNSGDEISSQELVNILKETADLLRSEKEKSDKLIAMQEKAIRELEDRVKELTKDKRSNVVRVPKTSTELK